MELKILIRLSGESKTYELYPVARIPEGFFREQGKYEFAVEIGEAIRSSVVELAVNDVLCDRRLSCGEAVFVYEPKFYAGDIRIALLVNGRVQSTFETVVDPNLSKLTRDEYASMVSEVASATLAIFRFGGVTIPASAGTVGQRPDIVALELVRSNIEPFERALSRIADRPNRALRSSSVRSHLLLARNVDDQAISGAFSRGKVRAAAAEEKRAFPSFVDACDGNWITEVIELQRKETLDIYEHRALLGFIRWLDVTLGLIRRHLVASLDDPEFKGPAARIWIGRIERWRTRLGMLSRRSLFDGLKLDPHLRATTVFRLHPDYATAFAAMSRMRAGLRLESGSATPAIPIDRTYQLYEYWCYIGVLRAVAARFPETRAQVARLVQGLLNAGELGFALSKGEMSHLSFGPGLRLSYQRSYAPRSQNGQGRTLLVEAVPDVVIESLDEQGRVVGIVVADPKYRKGSSLLDGIRDLHVYRDAIVDEAGNRLVKGAVAFAPRPGSLATDRFAIPSDVPGALAVRPGHDSHVFDRFITAAAAILGKPLETESGLFPEPADASAAQVAA